MSRRFARVLVTAVASLMMVAGLPAASHADTTILVPSSPNSFATRLTAPAGISAWSTVTFTLAPSGQDVKLMITNTTRKTITLKTTSMSMTYSDSTSSAQITASELNPITFTISPSTSMEVNVGTFDFVTWGHMEDLMLTSFSPTDRRMDITLSEVSTFDWSKARTKLAEQGLTASASGYVRANSIDNFGIATQFDVQGLFLPTCNNTSETKYIRIEETLIGGVHVPEAKKVIPISANACSDVWLGNSSNLYGQNNVTVDIVLGEVIKVDYSRLDTFLATKKLHRVSNLKFDTFRAAYDYEIPRTYVNVCSDADATVETRIYGTSYMQIDDFQGPHFTWQTTSTLDFAPKVLKARCSESRSTLLNISLWASQTMYDNMVRDPDFVIIINAHSQGDQYTGELPLDSTFDYSAARTIVNDSGLRAGAPASPLFDEATGRYWLRMHACNDTNVNRNLWMYAFTLEGVRTVLSEPVFDSIPGGTCSYVKLGYITNANDNFTNGLVTPEFMPRLAISSAGFDAKLRAAGLRRVGQFSVFDGADTLNTMSVFVPVCSNSGKERKIYVGASTITATFHTWTDGNQEVQIVPGTCPAGGNLMTIGTYDTADVTLRDLSEYLSLDTPQLIAATPSRVMQVGVTLPAGIQMETLASDLKFVPGVAPSVGETEVWANVNVPLANKAKRYSVNSLQIGGTSFNNPVTVAGACTTVTIAKKKYCQRKVKLANVPNNWIYGKTLNVSGRVGPLALRAR